MTQLTQLPESWQSDFTYYEATQYSGWVANEYWSALVEQNIIDPERLFDEENVIYWYKNNRNRLAEIKWPEKDLSRTVVLKAYGVRNLGGQLRALFRPSRAIRHFTNAELLNRKGFNTPVPVWLCVPRSKQGTYYLAVESVPNHIRLGEMLAKFADGDQRLKLESYTPERLKLLKKYWKLFEEDESKVEAFIQFCGRYIRQLHDNGLFHRDLSGGNLLISENWSGEMHDLASCLYIVDINRTRNVAIDQIRINARILDLERINIPERFVVLFYQAYAGKDESLQAEEPRFLRYRASYRRLKATRNPFWRLFLKITTYWVRTS